MGRGPEGVSAGRRPLWATVATVVVCLAVGALIALQGVSNLWLVGLGIALLPLLLLLDREVLVYLCFVATFTLNWLTLDVGVLPSQAQWLLEVCIALLLVRSLGTAYRRGSLRVPVIITALFVAFALSAVVGISSGLSPVIVLLGLRKYLRFPAIALALVIAPPQKGFERRAWQVIVACAALEVVVSLVQLATVGPGDLATGTFGAGGTGFEAIFLVGVASVVISRGVLGGGGIRFRDVMLGLVLFVPAVIGSAVAAYFLLPACVIFGVLAFGRRPTKVIATLAVVAVVVAVVAPYALEFTSSIGYVNASKLLSSPQAMLEYDRLATSNGRLGRIDQIAVAGSLTIGGDVNTALFGRGPAAASVSSLGSAFNGPLSQDALVRWVDSSVAVTLIELGLVGLAVFIAVGVYAIVISVRTVRVSTDPDLTVLSAFAAIGGFLMLVSGAYSVPWTIPGIALPFWVALGAVMSRRMEQAPKEGE